VTINAGEGFVGGKYIATDETFTVSLPASSTTTVFLGARDAVADTIVIGEASAFDPDDVRTAIFDFTTDSAGVTGVTDRRQLGTDTILTESLVSNSVDSDIVNAGQVLTSDLSATGSVTGIRDLIQVQSESDLPAVDPPQIAFIQDKNEYRRSLNTQGFRIDNASLQQTRATRNNAVTGVALSPDGTELFEADSSAISQFSLSTPFDISTASFQQSVSPQPPQNVSSLSSVTFKPDGTRLYETGTTNDKIFQSSLSTPFDLSTRTLQKSISADDSRPQGIVFNSDGTKLYEVGGSSDRITESVLSSSFDIGTATFNQAISSQDSAPRGLAFNSDGTKLFEIGASSGLIYESSLSDGFNLGTATFQRSIQTQDNDPTGLTFSPTGETLFEIGNGSDLIYQSSSSVQPRFRSFE
jgi:hypothetical protein